MGVSRFFAEHGSVGDGLADFVKNAAW